jgi:hypothetical protein
MRKLPAFLKKQNPRRGRQGSAGGWAEASSCARCQPKDPENSNVASRVLQARSLSNILALWTIALASIAFAVSSPAWPAGILFLARQAVPTGCSDTDVVAWEAAVTTAGGTFASSRSLLTAASMLAKATSGKFHCLRTPRHFSSCGTSATGFLGTSVTGIDWIVRVTASSIVLSGLFLQTSSTV